LAVAGPVSISLTVSSTGTDSDFVVKLIDGYPGNYPQPEVLAPSPGSRRRGPRRITSGWAAINSSSGRAVPGQVPARLRDAGSAGAREPAEIRFDLPDVYHVFRPGHRLIECRCRAPGSPSSTATLSGSWRSRRQGRRLPEGDSARVPRLDAHAAVEWGNAASGRGAMTGGHGSEARSQKLESQKPEARSQEEEDTGAACFFWESDNRQRAPSGFMSSDNPSVSPSTFRHAAALSLDSSVFL